MPSIMKDELMCLLRLVAIMSTLGCTCAIYAANSSDEIPNIYRDIEKLRVERDFVGVVRMLSKLDATEVWSFGGGLGPVDAPHLQLLTIRVSRDFAMPESDESRRIAQNAISQANLTEPEREWAKRLVAQVTDVQQVNDLLKSSHAPVRYIGLSRVEHQKRLDGDTVKLLRDIAASDPYILVQRVMLRSQPGQLPPPPGSEERSLITPLRDQAREILRQHNEPPPAAEASGAKLALARFSAESDSVEKRESIIEAIKSLSPAARRELVEAAQEQLKQDPHGKAGFLKEVEKMAERTQD